MNPDHAPILAMDFDRTIANTFLEGYGLRNVNTAYEYSIEDLFGHDAVVLFRSQGGTKDRAPTEIIVDLGIPHDQIIDKTNQLVDRKLSYIVPEIGKRMSSGELWPPLCEGFQEFWEAAQPFVKRRELITAVVSSGHVEYISKVFDAHRLPRPTVLITDDELRILSHVAPSRRHKPDPLMLELAVQQLGWSDMRGVTYIGDSLLNDGGMARKAHVPFGHFDPKVGAHIEHLNGGFRFGDWRVLVKHLPDLKFAR